MTAQFDVYRNTGKNRTAIPYVVIVQSRYFEKSRRRVVVPLVSADELNKTTRLPASTINPIFTIEGVSVIFNPLEIVSIPVESLGEWVATLADENDAIIAAMDELLSRAWG
ncbi:MAG: CcdB family protein [Sulfuricellaceae bacterium]|nr:CcdB family protein [Sulfuricellaceae bacterium]